MMQEIVGQITRTNGFEQIATANSFVNAFRSPRFKDVIMVADYTTEDLHAFDTCQITVKVMDVFDAICKERLDALKNTSLIICHKVTDIGERTSAKNVVLKIEENSYGLRKYIISYTDTSIEEIKKIDEAAIVSELHSKLQLGFADFIDTKPANAISEYDLVLQLFIKLPFMKMESSRSANELAPLSTFLEDKLKRHTKLVDFIRAESGSDSSGGFDVDTDTEIENLLTDSRIIEILNSSAGNN